MLFDILKAIAAKEKSTDTPAAVAQATEAPDIAAAAPQPDQAATPVVQIRDIKEKVRPPRKPSGPHDKAPSQAEHPAAAQAPERPAARPEASARPQQQPPRKGRPQGARPSERESRPTPRVTQAGRPEVEMLSPVPLPAGPAVRYMHPANRHLTWDGEGDQPDWVTAYLAHGGSWTAMENTAQKLAGQRRNPLE